MQLYTNKNSIKKKNIENIVVSNFLNFAERRTSKFQIYSSW